MALVVDGNSIPLASSHSNPEIFRSLDGNGRILDTPLVVNVVTRSAIECRQFKVNARTAEAIHGFKVESGRDRISLVSDILICASVWMQVA